MTQIISLQKLYAICHKLRATNTTVLVTGVFDILHTEHQKLLHKAKKLGDILIVGLEPDSRVKKLKGESRPKNTINKRQKNLVALNIADYVFKLPSLSTPIKRQVFIKQLKPHILAVSSSTPHLSEKRRLMKLVNGQAKVVIPHNPTISTTKLLS